MFGLNIPFKLCISAEVGAAMVSGGAGVLGSILNSVNSNKNTKRWIKSQAEENEKAYQRNIEQWNRENDYNSPAKAMQRLRDAGLNPNLAYGSPNVSSPSPQASPTDVSALGSMRSPVADALTAANNQRLIEAQIRNMDASSNQMNSSADVNRENATSLKTYNSYANALFSKQIEEGNARISLNLSQAQLNDMATAKGYREMDKLAVEIDKLNAEIDNISSATALLDEQTFYQQIMNYFATPKAQAELSLMYSQSKMYSASADLTYQEYKELCASEIYNLATKKAQADLFAFQGVNAKKEGELLDFEISEAAYHNKHKAGLTAISAIGTLVGGAANLASGYYMYSLGRSMNTKPMGRIGFTK